MKLDKKTKEIGVTAGTILLLLLAAYIFPIYRVWLAEMSGKAALAHAKYAKEVAVATAKANYEAAVWDARTDTARAHGINRSNQIIGSGLTTQYLQWLWIQNLEKQDKSVIYVPSVNGIPTMPVQEATRLQPPPIIQQQP
jgi:hypothetical protein